jgi:peptide/nickel transport system substrate-binding protein
MKHVNGARRGALAAAVVVATAVLAACSSSPASAPSGNTSSSASAATTGGAVPNGSAGQTLTVQATEPTSLSPALGPVDESGVVFIYLAYGALIYLTQDGTFVPDLATKWGYVPGSGNKEFDITLRAGLKFTDGTAVTPQAVANSLEYFKNAHGPQAYALAAMTSAEPTGPLSLRLTFAVPTPDLPYLFSQSQDTGAIIGPKGLADPASLAAQSDGAGPYAIKASDIIPNNQYTYTANPGYWNQAALHYHQIVVKSIDDQNTIMSSLQSGQLDASLHDVSAASAAAGRAAGLTTVSTPYAIAGLVLADRAGTMSPLGNLKVREAINDAVDRQSYAGLISGPSGIPTDQVSIPGAVGYSASAAQVYSYNIAKAKELLAQAGYPHGFTLPVLDVQSNDPNSTIAQALASSLSAIGIKVSLTVEPTFGQFIPAAMSKKYPAIVVPIPFDGAGFYYAMRLALSSPIWNPFGTTDPALTSLLGQAAAAQTPAQEAPFFDQVSARLTQLAWFVPVVTQNFTFLVSPKVSGVGQVSLAATGVMNPVGPEANLSWYAARS